MLSSTFILPRLMRNRGPVRYYLNARAFVLPWGAEVHWFFLGMNLSDEILARRLDV